MISASEATGRFRLDQALARELEHVYGTPLYVLDEATIRRRIRAYRAGFGDAYAKFEISYASKANSTLAVLAIAASEGCKIDVASEGELRAALAAGVDPFDCHLHGNNKSEAELAYALRVGVSQIIVDNRFEIETIHAIWPKGSVTKLLLRLAPGVDPVTHELISTGNVDTKFGFNISDGSAEKAVRQCQKRGLPLVGFHCHVGSQLLDPEAQRAGGEAIAKFAADMHARHGLPIEYLNVGGGMGAHYTADDHPLPIDQYCRLVADAVVAPLAGTGLAPTLGQEPGRSLVAEAGVTLYRVGVIKQVPGRTYVCVDGGLADNPRPAIYGAPYDIEAIPPHLQQTHHLVTVSGRHCESDRLFPNVWLPADLAVGDLVQVLCTGAYNASMASNYNRYPRPASVLIRLDGSHCLVQRRESFEEMLAREILPAGLAEAGLF